MVLLTVFSRFNKLSIATVYPVLPDTIGVRANIHLGGQTEFCPNGFSGGGGSSTHFPEYIFCGGGGSSKQKFSGIHILWGGRIFSVNCGNRP